MQYLGGGVGHMATNDHTQVFRPHYMKLNVVGEDTQAGDLEMADDEVFLDGIEADMDLEVEEAASDEEGDLEEEQEEEDTHRAGPLHDDAPDAGGTIRHGSREYEDEYGHLGYAAF
ncbi:hypothetical protein CVT24_006703 [Panaeolus cyanescens]|uniref:Uncharacterized protein n=1 Tax=Panaeolus cyanescens TaxID=181874 RepID=A0A409X952_9AGAR|nr:hypothetical protein CVT24_006703 [Panaeolus cyanescens]